jgi:hypothetical protein
MSARLDLTGRRFGRLTVLAFSHVEKAHFTMWNVLCDCETEFIARGTALTSRNTTQCLACQHLAAQGNQRAKKHGHSSVEIGTSKPSATYESWKAMMARCYTPTNASWAYYGGKGIKVCERWHDFETFLADMGERPPGMTLHRIDSNKDYEPSNCEWKQPPH